MKWLHQFQWITAVYMSDPGQSWKMLRSDWPVGIGGAELSKEWTVPNYLIWNRCLWPLSSVCTPLCNLCQYLRTGSNLWNLHHTSIFLLHWFRYQNPHRDGNKGIATSLLRGAVNVKINTLDDKPHPCLNTPIPTSLWTVFILIPFLGPVCLERCSQELLAPATQLPGFSGLSARRRAESYWVTWLSWEESRPGSFPLMSVYSKHLA